MDGAIGAKRVTYDFARQMEGATEIKCSEFGDATSSRTWRKTGRVAAGAEAMSCVNL